MAASVTSARLAARLVCRHAASPQARRMFCATTRDCAAQNFTMPALSPTMTEGNIAAWRVKDGEAFSAGDVILEIETDKATMDVEAQDDGIMMKVLESEGSKGVKVGRRIAVIAEPGDDISSLELPKDDSDTQKTEPTSKSETKSEDQPKASTRKSEEQQSAQKDAENNKGKENGAETSAQQNQEDKPKARSGSRRKQSYPLYPSVEHLLHQNGLSKEEAAAIHATGPNGRLLKGDVLAHLGKIDKKYPAEASKRIGKLAHLDLSNIQIAKPSPKPESKMESAKPDLPAETEIAVPISLANVIATQKRVQDSLGIFLPLSTFIARASELSNEELPRSKAQAPSSDELFDAVLGLNQIPHTSRGHFTPQISGISPAPQIRNPVPAKRPDIIDILTNTTAKPHKTASSLPIGISSERNVFSVSAKAGEEHRATAYLERMKLALEEDPGRLVL